MSIRQDETDVNFLDIKPADLEAAAKTLRHELEANRRSWERTVWALDYVRKTYPQDTKLIDALDTIRHHLERRM
ncbi:MAG: hypothetical protein J6S08_04800 [Duodenibacillus sp.]|jgi:hypothetical protein|nr:hypothetical protein [Duodenibacillus sp.]